MKHLIFGALLLPFALAANAAIIFTGGGTLTGSQEVPPHATGATGTAVVTVDDQDDQNPNTNLFSWNVTFQDLSSDFFAAHFHGPAPAGVNAPILIPISTGPQSVTSGTLVGQTHINALFFEELVSGLWYVNVHSVNFKAGEIRAQITGTTVPEPSSMALLGAALLGLAGAQRRSRREQAG